MLTNPLFIRQLKYALIISAVISIITCSYSLNESYDARIITNDLIEYFEGNTNENPHGISYYVNNEGKEIPYINDMFEYKIFSIISASSIIISAGIMIFLFISYRDEKYKNTASFLYSLPIPREYFYIYKILCFFIVVTVPIILTAFITKTTFKPIIISISPYLNLLEYASPENFYFELKNDIISELNLFIPNLFLIFAILNLLIVISGRIYTAYCIFAGIPLTILAFASGISNFIDLYLQNSDIRINIINRQFILPTISISLTQYIEKNVIFNFIISFVLIVIGFFLYKKSKPENLGKLFTINCFNYILYIAAFLIGGVIFFRIILFKTDLNGSSIFSGIFIMLIGSFLSLIITKTLISKIINIE